MRFAEVTLAAPASALSALSAFYGERLGLPCDSDLQIAVGETALRLEGGDGTPFYHFALLVPGDRFDAAHTWAATVADLLPGPGGSETVFDFSDWNAHACYLHDPVGNIVELIAHHDLAETGRHGAFTGAELVGLSEVGLVGDPAALARELADGLGLETWDGDVAVGSRLGFVGSRARTFVLCAAGRGWLPTGRPAEPHPVRARLHGTWKGQVALWHGTYRIAGA